MLRQSAKPNFGSLTSKWMGDYRGFNHPHPMDMQPHWTQMASLERTLVQQQFSFTHTWVMNWIE